MTENKRYNIKPSKIIEDGFCIQDDEKEHSFPTTKDVNSLIMYGKVLNDLDEQNQKNNQEIIACYDTLTTIHELCDAVLNYDFEGVVSKVDFCNMLIEMDNKDLAFLKECFEAIRDNDLKTMTSLTLECKYGGDVND